MRCARQREAHGGGQLAAVGSGHVLADDRPQLFPRIDEYRLVEGKFDAVEMAITLDDLEIGAHGIDRLDGGAEERPERFQGVRKINAVPVQPFLGDAVKLDEVIAEVGVDAGRN